MASKRRGPGQTQISVSLERDLLGRIDARAASLRMARSAYLVQLVRNDLEVGGPLTVTPESPKVVYPLTGGEHERAAEAGTPYGTKKKKSG